MRKKSLVICFLLVCLGMVPVLSFADDVTFKAVKEGEWTIIDSKGNPLGTLRRVEDDAFSIQLQDGPYIGIITKTGHLQTNQRHPLLAPNDMQLYLDVLKALPQLKQQK